MTPLVEALRACVELLEAWGQPWALVGGAALIARIRSRLTDDLDLAITVAKGREPAFLERARGAGFTWEEGDERFFLEGGLLRARSPSADTVDFMIADDALYAQVVLRAQPLAIGQLQVRVATVEDLLLMKLDANRPLDFDDAIAIKDACGTTLDRSYLREAGARFALLPQLENLLGPL